VRVCTLLNRRRPPGFPALPGKLRRGCLTDGTVFSKRRVEGHKKDLTKGVAAFADIEVGGSGYLDDWWLVDGQVVEQVKKYVSFGQKVIFSTSGVPGILTFVPGLHAVQLQLGNPVPPFDLPGLVLMITGREAGAAVFR